MLRNVCLLFTFTLPLLIAAPAIANDSPPDVNERLIAYYAKPQNYRSVKRDVLDWHKTTRNGCVAFVSTALRHVGFDVPPGGKRAGYAVSRVTFALSEYLEERGWIQIGDTEDLIPGDLVFTTGYPDHVYVFHSWRSSKRRLARIIDNKGLLTTRAMFPPTTSSDAAFAYALRAPVDAP